VSFSALFGELSESEEKLIELDEFVTEVAPKRYVATDRLA